MRAENPITVSRLGALVRVELRDPDGKRLVAHLTPAEAEDAGTALLRDGAMARGPAGYPDRPQDAGVNRGR